ncbi:S41 family peptidase [Paenibacillus sediminis]|nr:S41 family peptidase [Paenibacillus sediminis]
MFKGRTVLFLLMITMLGSILLTMTLTGQFSFASGAQGQGILASSDSSGLNQDEMNKINTAVQLIQSHYFKDVDRQKLVDGAINGMMESLDDPFSSYMGKETAQQFSESIEGSFTGIGAEVSMESGNVVVVSPIKGSPAEKAGIKAKDVILSVNGVSLQGLDLNAAVAKIRGPKGTTAKVKIKRSGNPEPLEFSIVRDDIDMETVNAHMEKNGIGVIEITQFSVNTADRFKEELAKLEKQNMKGLVIDVRNNPGGVLSVVIDIAEQFVPKGKNIVQVEDKSSKREKSVSSGTGKPYPITVLTNQGSASASEILAGALKESAGAKLIGEKTYGKGTVQSSYDKQFNDGSLLKITIAKWLTPNGEWIHKKGIEPDIKVHQPDYFSVSPINKDKTPLKYDMTSDDVKSAQIMLDGLGFKPGRKDGYFDKGTVNAVKQFQKKQGLPVNGTVDKKTAEALETALIKHIRDPQYDTQMKQAIKILTQEIAASASKK